MDSVLSWSLRLLNIKYSITFIIQPLLIYLAMMNIIAFLLRLLNFSYWRLFTIFKYPIIILSFFTHVLEKFIIPDYAKIIVSYPCVAFISIYLIDFSWFVG